MQSVTEAIQELQSLGCEGLGGSRSLLWGLVAPERGWTEAGEALAVLEDATDWRDALATGRVVPAQVGLG